MTDNNENNEPTVLDTPAQISAWVFLSRMHREMIPGWEPSPSVARAMTGGTK